jgi:hypothetical protein
MLIVGVMKILPLFGVHEGWRRERVLRDAPVAAADELYRRLVRTDCQYFGSGLVGKIVP